MQKYRLGCLVFYYNATDAMPLCSLSYTIHPDLS